MDPYVHLPRLAAELGDGWTVAEHAELTSPGGVAVTVSVSRAPDGADAAALGAIDAPVLADAVTRLAGVAAGGVARV